MTWKDLKKQIEEMTEEEQDLGIMFFDNRNQYHPVVNIQFPDNSDQHVPFLTCF